MLDFLVIATRSGKRGIIEIYPKFIIKKSSDLMIRGGDFYAIWIEERGLWSTDEQDAVDLIDRELDRYAEENCKRFDDNYRVMHMWDAETGMIDTWHKYCQKQMKDQFHMLDEKLIFSNSKTGKKDYASKMLNYPLEQGEANSYDKLMSVLYSPAERHKIEWAIGSVVSGDSKRLQKFMVLYGAAGTGKSTVLNIIQQLFDGYYSVFDAIQHFQCKRMSSLFKDVAEDGTVTYSDVNRVQLINKESPDIPFRNGFGTRLIDKMYPITLPYFPADKKFKIIVEEFLTDEKNGDFDTVGYLQLILPNGNTVELNGYFKDGPEGMVRIEQAEYEERKANRIDKK